MSDKTNGPRPEDGQGGTRAGQLLQQARLAAHIEANKICADLRISPQALEALEQGNYHLLPGDPYIRALLGSMSRYLGLDPAVIVREYNQEIGAAPQEPVAAPYTDKAQTHTTAHKQIFIIIVLALFVVLFLLIGRLNRGEKVPSLPAVGSMAPTDSLAMPGDSTPESKALAPDSLGAAPGDSASRDSAAVAPAAAPASNTAAPVAQAPATQTPPAAGVQGPQPAPKPDTAGMTVAIIKPLEDSVGVKVIQSGKEPVPTLLRLGKQIQVTHTDTITVFTSKRGAVEVTVGGKSVTPQRKRFKIYGTTVKAF